MLPYIQANGEKKIIRNTFVIEYSFVKRQSVSLFSESTLRLLFHPAKVAIWLAILSLWMGFVLNAQPASTGPVKKVKYFEISSQVIKEIYFVDAKNTSVKNGAYTSYFASGKVKAKGFYKNNLPEGCWERYYETGSLRSVSTYKSGILQGPGSTYFENGKLAQSGFYLNDKEDSIWRFYYESGKMKSLGIYENGSQRGFWKYFHEDSTLKASAYLENGKGHYKEYFGNGNVRMEGVIRAGVSDSIWKYFHENGVIKAIGHEKSGERQGYWKFFFPNGNLSSEGHFKDNEKFGRWKYYHEAGGISSEGDLDKDAKEGVWKFFFPGGGLMGEGTFVKGNGEYQEYYDNGKIKLKGKIENDLYQGNWTYYFEDGGLEGECNYLYGYGKYKGYYENGSIKMTGQMHNGQKTGSWDLLGRDGKLIGHYKTFYDLIQPIAPKKEKKILPDSVQAKPRNPGKPDYLFNRRKSRHFVPKVNEVKGFIIAFNPFALAISSIPFGIEYYLQDRLGYEVMFTVFRQPFFANHSEDIENKRVYTIGNSIDFRQKLYSADHGSGNMYIGQELRLSNYTHNLFVIEASDSLKIGKTYEGEETKIEFSFLVGNRLFREYNKHNTLTLDLYAGIGFGYRYARIPDQLLIYNRLKTNRLTIPIRLGFNFGFLF